MLEVGENSTDNPQDVEEIVHTLRQAAKTVGEGSAGVLNMFHAAPSTVLFAYLAPGTTTLDELRGNAENLAEHATGVVFDYPKVIVRVLSGDVAYSMAYSHLEATLDDERQLARHEHLAKNRRQMAGDPRTQLCAGGRLDRNRRSA